MIPPPPRSPLFPYTTLFRSAYLTALLREMTPNPLTPPSRLVTSSDRKSTRLNFSHDQISYAVFCLKKKKQQNTSHPNDRRIRCHMSPQRRPGIAYAQMPSTD